MRLSENVRDLKPSATIAVATRAKELRAAGRDIIDLSAGEPDFATPEFICRGGIGAIEQGFTKYTPVAGIPALRQAIAADLSKRSSIRVDPAGIVVGAGAKQSLFNACFSLFGPSDRVLIPAPYWTSYPEIVQLARAEPVAVMGDVKNGFKVTVQHLDKAYDKSVRGLIMNSPSNPTGSVYTRAELEAIVRWASERGIWLISDEIYGRLNYDEPGPAASVLGMDAALLERVVVINGASKTFAMTGWRIGFSYSSNELASALTALQSQVSSNASTPAQYAAIAAYKAEPPHDEAVGAMISLFRRRRDMLLDLVRTHLPGLEFVPPAGAFYLFLRMDSAGAGDSTTICTQLLEEQGVALVPGGAFGEERYARLSFAASEQAITEGIRRIAQFLHAVPKREASMSNA
jgi:aspartate aminotransferase